MAHILIVEDDLAFGTMMQTWLKKKGFETSRATNVLDAARLLKDGGKVDLVLSDLRLPDRDGLFLLSWMQKHDIAAPFIVMTNYAEVQNAVLAMKSGAADYIAKPMQPDILLQKIKDALAQATASTAVAGGTSAAVAGGTSVAVDSGSAVAAGSRPAAINKGLAATSGRASTSTGSGSTNIDNGSAATVGRDDAPDATVPRHIEGKSEASQQLYSYVKLVAPTPMSVLILGASGTGKEYVAQRIHELSSRSGKPFFALDCGAIPKDVAASEFFGHKKGSFTGADSDKRGAFETANGGTLFLDEVGNLSYDVQVQLLRALQERRIRPVGGDHEIPVDIRLVCATNENLEQAVAEGRFREDLYHRINEFTIYTCWRN